MLNKAAPILRGGFVIMLFLPVSSWYSPHPLLIIKLYNSIIYKVSVIFKLNSENFFNLYELK